MIGTRWAFFVLLTSTSTAVRKIISVDDISRITTENVTQLEEILTDERENGIHPSQTPKKQKVAVVGCGVAGALTALELAHVHKAEVTVIDREEKCGVGTSGRIAAEMMFYSLDKDLMWKAPTASEFVTGKQTDINYGGWSRLKAFKKKKAVALGTTKKVTFRSYLKTLITFEKGVTGPKVASINAAIWRTHCSRNCDHPNLLIGYELDSIDRLSLYRMPGGEEHKSVGRMIEAEATKVKRQASKTPSVTLTFRIGHNPGASPAHQAAFFQAAAERLKSFYLETFPELCEAVITPFCCEQGSKMRQWVQNNPIQAGYTCPGDALANGTGDSPGFGVAHVFWRKGHAQNSVHTKYKFDEYSVDQTKRKLSDFVKKKDKVFGSLVTRQASGFVRTEKLFDIIEHILEKKATWHVISSTAACETNNEGIAQTFGDSGYSLEACKAMCEKTSGCVAIDYIESTRQCNIFDAACTKPLKTADGAASYKKGELKYGAKFEFKKELTLVTPSGRIVSLKTKKVQLSWKDEDGHKVANPRGAETTLPDATYDRVVITTGAAAVGGVAKALDPQMAKELIPVFGCIVLSKGAIIQGKQRQIGVVHEELHQYLRATVDGRLAIGGGGWFGNPKADDENVRALPYRRKSRLHLYHMSCDGVLSKSGAGKQVVSAEGTTKLGGVRPVSYLFNFPLVKWDRTSERTVIHTGAGANGYVISWKAAQLAAELVMKGQPEEDKWGIHFNDCKNAQPGMEKFQKWCSIG